MSTDPPTTAALREVADSIGMNAPHLADMLNAYVDGDIRVGIYIERHNAWIRGEATESARVKALREAAAAIVVWDQPQEGWPAENRCDRATVRRLTEQLRAMADSAERRTVLHADI